MPSVVKELTPLQHTWLYDNQRTLSEAGSSELAPDGEDRTARCYMDSQTPMDKSSIFRERSAPPTTMTLPPPSSSPSWNQHHNEPEERRGVVLLSPSTTAMPPGLQAEEERSNKRRKFSYSHHYLHHNPSYYDHPSHQDPSYHPHIHHQQLQLQHHGYPIYEREDNNIFQTPHLHMDQRDETPSQSERFPVLTHQGDKLSWQESYENLVAYKEHYGDCSVPQKYAGNPKLGGWVNKQRKKNRNPAKYGRLKREHEDLLTDLGFKWS
jgi:hypothetical protein